MCSVDMRFFYLDQVEKHIRVEESLNCHRVAEDCFIEVFGGWLSPEDGTVWSYELNKMFMSLSLLTTGNSLHLHRLELMKVCTYILYPYNIIKLAMSSKFRLSICVVPLLLNPMLYSIVVPLYKTLYPSLKVSLMDRFCHMHTQPNTYTCTHTCVESHTCTYLQS